ncbi:peptidoglycan binding domain containing protein [Phlyctema vagabunda]|uniref:Peptidoglycan binding domain containing protein n=1 Tax=Phlyctema vagabunda TaxID=108571 RepID=A0ABR4P2V2_9HELO
MISFKSKDKSSSPHEPIPKRIVICCDGTWQNSATAKPNIPSNVTQICRSLARTGHGVDGKVYQQIVFYDAGVGTGDLSSTERNSQGATGRGLNVNVIAAYNFLINNYTSGDELFFFGFSRGAYTTRAVAGLVCEMGILSPTEMHLFPELYTAHKKTSMDETKLSVNDWWFKHAHHLKYTQPREDVSVKAIGVWDTVAALGMPSERKKLSNKYKKQYLFHKTNIHPRIENAFQALALDERRSPFQPVVWYQPESNTTTNLLQVWFPGVHLNVGGGDSDALLQKYKGDHEQMAHITLAWMLDCMAEFLNFDLAAAELALHANDLGPSSRHGMGEVVNGARYASGKIKDSFSGFIYWVLGSKPRTPGDYRDISRPEILLKALGLTNEEIHPSVYCRQVGTNVGRRGKDSEKRMAKNRYAPVGLTDFRRVQQEVGWYWYRPQNDRTACGSCKVGTSVELRLPEYVIPPKLGTKPSMERMLMEHENASKRLLRELDAGNGLAVVRNDEN